VPLGDQFDAVLGAARAGGDWAWRELYRDTAPALAGYLRARGVTDVDDVVGDTFVTVVGRIGSFSGGEPSFRAWIFTIGRNLAIDAHRARTRRPADPTPMDVLAETGPQGDVEADALAQLGRERVISVLEALTHDQRDVLLLRILGGLSIDEVATVTHRNVGAVKMLQHRGIGALRREIARGAVTL